jgi:Protein of unknown function (DUF3667)
VSVRGGEGSTATICANCAEPLNGRYCSACGQRHQPHIHSLREFLSEATEVVTHADSRLWRTLSPLLFRPGFLTRQFLRGRRARYLPPFRLYIVASVIFFLIAAAGTRQAAFVRLGTEAAQPTSITGLTLPQLSTATGAESPEQRAARICDSGRFGFGAALEPRLKESCRRIVVDGGRGLVEALYHNIPRGLIVLLPLLALVMRVMYLRRYYVEHLLFFVHNHAFTFLFLSIYTLAIRFITTGWFVGLATTAVTLLVPYYTYRAMLRVYGQSKWVTRLKFTVLAFAYMFCVILMGILTSLYTVITL